MKAREYLGASGLLLLVLVLLAAVLPPTLAGPLSLAALVLLAIGGALWALYGAAWAFWRVTTARELKP